VLIDGARFLPTGVTITKATATVYSSSGAPLSSAIEGVALPEGPDAGSPAFAAAGVVGAAGGGAWEDPTATIMFQVGGDGGGGRCRVGCVAFCRDCKLLPCWSLSLAIPLYPPINQVHTLDRFTRRLAVVGFALLPAFLDPREGGQPVSRSIRDYVLNQVGAGAGGREGSWASGRGAQCDHSRAAKGWVSGPAPARCLLLGHLFFCHPSLGLNL
jgi:hypothetical protein